MKSRRFAEDVETNSLKVQKIQKEEFQAEKHEKRLNVNRPWIHQKI